MSTFEERSRLANTIVEQLNDNFWRKLPKLGYPIDHVPFGYETRTPSGIQDKLKKINSDTAYHIRYAPDYFVINGTTDVFLLEYKVMRTPRFSERKNQWHIGQMEAEAKNNYKRLQRCGVDVAILIYCPYHSRPLLAGFWDDGWLIRSRTSVKMTRGSGTDYVNIDLSLVPSFDEFAEETLGIPQPVTQSLLGAQFFAELRSLPILQTDHHPSSPCFNDRRCETGFNWESRYTGK